MALLLWDVVIAATIGQPRTQHHLRRGIHWIERSAGVVLILLAITLFV
ncbi:hypothetical protein [Vibrio sp. CAU 1672]|nr:hypothetical protein [Vibrio sp. CAU 1672]MDF2153090.1 hypothetical protein [Vibrio sp. CAU 1672]